MESGINKYWKQLYDFNMYVSHDCHFTILDRTWNDYGGNFFISPRTKEFYLWI